MKKNRLLQIVRALFPMLEKWSPRLADRLFTSLFFRTFKPSLKSHHISFLQSAEPGKLKIEGRTVMTYKWGHGPKRALFVHGWMGHSAQFRQMISSFTDQGYTCYAFDAPAHGLSPGSRSDLLQFRNSIFELREKTGKFDLIIAHSLGAMAAALVNRNSWLSNKCVFISSPALAAQILNTYADGLHASTDRFAYLQHTVYARFGIPFGQLMLSENIGAMPGSVLQFIYDRDDEILKEDPVKILLQKRPDAHLMLSNGLGHNGILKDKRVIERCLEFAEDSEIQVRSSESPVLRQLQGSL
jgi:pimeloyl-ACP methyl ester carboxylesterase